MGMLRHLALESFRNYDQQQIDFEPGINLLIGQNGQGKTNLLEAIHFLAILRSFRTSKVNHLRRWGNKLFRLRGLLENGTRRTKLAIEYGQARRVSVDGHELSRASDFIRHFYCETFVPEDIGLVKGTGSDRRRFLDIAATQIFAPYLGCLQDYNKALKTRNALLRKERLNQKVLQAYDKVLIERGGMLLYYRQLLLDELSGRLEETSRKLFPEGMELTLRYAPGISMTDDESTIDDTTAALQQELEGSFDRDRARQHTTRGPHRDDLHLALNGHPLAEFGSEGQCRLGVLALKMATGDMILARKEDDIVIWLVDDVVGELDERAKGAFFQALSAASQTFIVATSDTVFSGMQPSATFRVEDGQITRALNGPNPAMPEDPA